MATLVELKAKAKKMGYKGYSRMKKAEIEKLLTTPPPKPKRLKSKAEQAKNPVRQVQLPKKGTPAEAKPAPKKLETEPLVALPKKPEPPKPKTAKEREEEKLAPYKADDLLFELKDNKGEPVVFMARKSLAKVQVLKDFINVIRTARKGGSQTGFSQQLNRFRKIDKTSGREKLFKQFASKMDKFDLYRFERMAGGGGIREGIGRIRQGDRDKNYVGSDRQRVLQQPRLVKPDRPFT